MLTELNYFAAVCVSGIIIMISSEDVGLIFSNLITIFYFIISFTNDKIQDKISEINYAWYNLPWYNLPINEQKLMFMAMNYNFLKQEMNAGSSHPVSLEQFLNVMRSAYENLLIIYKLLKQ